MFGWEFPPHISGGLGTACAGLTHALEKENVNILFVVPKLHGGEKAEQTHFIDASHIPILQKKFAVASRMHAGTKAASDKENASAKGNIPTHQGDLQRIEVSSYLSPYGSVSEPQSAYGVEHWNYSFDSSDERSIPAQLKSSGSGSSVSDDNGQRVKEAFAFSGTYGPDVLVEVQRYAQTASEIAAENTFDVIHSHDWMTYPAGIQAKNISGKPLIVHVHATEIDRSGERVNEQVFAIEKDGMTQADKVITVSNWTKNIAIKYYGIDADKIEVVHNGITPKHDTENNVPPPPIGSHIVTFLGRITHQKGPMYFVEAARKVHAQFPEAHFIVAGSGDQLPLMIERIAELKLSSHFHFTGFLKGPDIDTIWAVSNVYVMPSVSEPFGIAPLEAIQAGVPVIISHQAGVSEVMPHAIKVDFWNRDALAEAICNVLRFKSLANTLKKNSAEEIKAITWNKAAKKLTTLYYELNAKHEKAEKSHLILSGSPTKKAAHTPVF